MMQENTKFWQVFNRKLRKVSLYKKLPVLIQCWVPVCFPYLLATDSQKIPRDS